MNEINLNPIHSAIIDDCCNKLQIDNNFEPDNAMYESITDLGFICDDLQIMLNTIQDAVSDIKLSVADHDIDKIVLSLKTICDVVPDFSANTKDITKAISDAVAHLKSVGTATE